MGSQGQFDIDPRKSGGGAFGLTSDGRFMICDRCCGPCSYCPSAPSAYLITLGDITLCPGWTGSVAGTWNVPFAGASGFSQSCNYIRRPAFNLTYNGVVYAFWIYLAVQASAVRLRVLYDRNPYFEVFNNTIGNNIYQPVPDCGLIGTSLASAITNCNQGTNGFYVGMGTGGWASFEAA